MAKLECRITLFKSDKAFGRSLINIYGFLPVIAYFMIFI